MLKFNTYRAKRYLRSRFVEGTFLLASEASDLELELIEFTRALIRYQVGDVAIADAWKVERIDEFNFRIRPGEAWYRGLPYFFNSSTDPLVSGANLSAGIVPTGTVITDDPAGTGKLVTLSSVVPNNTFRVVVQAREEVITDVQDGFLKNANLGEATAQKIRLNYVINIVPESKQIESPVPYRSDNSTDENLVNEISVQVGGSNHDVGTPGSLAALNTVTGSEELDGRDLELTINNPSLANPLPKSVSNQDVFANGKLIDNVGNEYHIVSIFNNPADAANQDIIRLDKAPSQPDPVIALNASYTLVKRDVYVTDVTNGTPSGKSFYPIANFDWKVGDGLVHDSVITDLRKVIQSTTDSQDTSHKKFDLRLSEGGSVTAEPTQKATGTFTISDYTLLAGDTFEVRGVTFQEGVDFTAETSNDTTAQNLVDAINATSNILIDGVLQASAATNVVTLTAKVGGTTPNSYTISFSDDPNGAAASGATLAGGLDAIPGQLAWAADFQIVDPHSQFKHTIAASDAVLKTGGALAYFLNYDTTSNVNVEQGELSLTTTTSGTSISLSGAPDLSDIKKGNTLLIQSTGDSASITEVDDVNKTVTVDAAVTGTGSATVYLDTFAPGTLPLGPETFVLAVKTANTIKITNGASLESGESTSGDGSNVPQQLLDYIGSNGETDDSPNYASTFVVGQGDNLTKAISDLDAYAEDENDRANEDRNAKLISGGTWNWDGTTLSWSADAYISFPSRENDRNTITAGSVAMASDTVAYVEMNRAVDSTTVLPVLTATVSSFVVSDDKIVIARREGSDVIVGTHSFRLKTGEYLEIDGALAEINRHVGQFKLDKNLSNDDEVDISSSDTNLLDSSTLSQQLNGKFLDFDTTTVNFTAGSITGAAGYAFTPFTIPVGEYFWYGVSLIGGPDSGDGRTQALVKVTSATAANAVQASAPYPEMLGDKKLGAVLVQNNGGAIEVVEIRRVGPSSVSGQDTTGIIVDLYEPIATALPTGVVVIDGQSVVNGDVVLFSNLITDNNQIYKAVESGGSVSAWEVERSFDKSSLTPVHGETVQIKRGVFFANQTALFDGTDFGVNNTVRLFDGPNSTDHWELGSIKSVTLVDNTTNGVIFSVPAANSENWIINYSVLRGTDSQTGQLFMTSEGVNVSVTSSGAYLGDDGVEFDADWVAGDIRLLYTTSSTGVDAIFKFFTFRWSNLGSGPGGVPSYSSGPQTVVSPGSSTDNALVKFSGITGQLIQDTGIIVDGSDNVTGANDVTLTGVLTSADGTPAIPAHGFTSEAGTGLHFEGSYVGISRSGNDAIKVGGATNQVLIDSSLGDRVGLKIENTSVTAKAALEVTALSEGEAVKAVSNGAADTVYAKNNSSGHAGYFESDSVTKSSLYATSANRYAAHFTSASTTQAALYSESTGIGIAGRFENNSAEANTQAALTAINNSETANFGVGMFVNEAVAEKPNLVLRSSYFTAGWDFRVPKTVLAAQEWVAPSNTPTIGQVLSSTTAGGTVQLQWIDFPAGFVDPMTTAGDMIYRTDPGNVTARLPRGADEQVLTSTATGIEWATPPAGLSFPLEAPDDVGGLPSYNFASATTTGMQLSSTNIEFVRASVVELAVTQNQVLNGNVGSTGTPAWSFTDDPNTGVWSSAADTLNFSTGGVERLELSSAGMRVGNSFTIPLTDGLNNQVLRTNGSGAVSWSNVAGFADPMTTRGDMIYRNAGNSTVRLPVGAPGQILTSDGTDVSWEAAGAGFADPMTTRGDIIFRDAANATNKLSAGTVGQVLTSDGTDVSWDDPVAEPTYPLSATNGTVGAPSIGFASSPSTGLWKSTVSTNPAVNFSLGGAQYFELATSGLKIGTGVTSFILPVADGAINQVLTTDGAGIVSWSLPPGSGGPSFPLTSPNTTAAAPGYTFSTATDTGMHLESGVNLQFSVDGINSLILKPAPNQILAATDGSAADPVWSFSSVENMGMYRSGTELRFATAGAERLSVSSGGINVGGGVTGYNLPITRGTDGQVLETDASGNVTWETPAGAGGGINDIVEDLTPQLGGDLDLQTFKITSSTANQDIIIELPGTGSFQLDSAGNARGSSAIDLQRSRSVATQVASGANSFIGGGTGNTTIGARSAVVVGASNTASGVEAFVGAGNDNVASGDWSFIGGGDNHTASGARSSVVGGFTNEVNGSFSAVLGGRGHVVSGDNSAIVVGRDNVASGDFATVLGGRGNTAATSCSVVMGSGAMTQGQFDFVIGNAPDTSTAPSSVDNVHFKVTGFNSVVHIGRSTNQAFSALAENKLVFHTILASNQSRNTTIRAHDALTASYDIVLPDGPPNANGDILSADTSGNLSWTAAASGWSTSTVAGAGPHAIANDSEVFVDTSSAAAVVNLPAASKGQRIRFIDDTGNWFTNNVTVNSDGSDTIDGVASPLTLNVNNSIVELIGDTGNWRVVVLKP